MPSAGGTSGKAGDHYEALWVVQALLRVVMAEANFVTYESLDVEESRGVEFTVQTSSREMEYWSLKRQTTAAGWSLAALARVNEQGRSILGDLQAHVERDERNIGVFASTLGAAKLEELCSASATLTVLEERLSRSAELKAHFDKYVLALCGDDKARAQKLLTRLRVRTSDEASLRMQIKSTIALLFYDDRDIPTDAAEVRRSLTEYVVTSLHQMIDKQMVHSHLATIHFRRKDWKFDLTVRENVLRHCEAYTKPLVDQFISGVLQALPGAEQLLGADNLPISRRTLIVGDAGGGKSAECANVVNRLRDADVPVLPVRMDQIDESVLTPQQLGLALSLPASPVAVLAGLADGGNCVLLQHRHDHRPTAPWSYRYT